VYVELLPANIEKSTLSDDRQHFYEIVRMVPVFHDFVPAVGSMNVVGGMSSAFVIRCTAILIRRAVCERVFVHMIAVDMVQVPLV
jgi:hypothetical protein